MNFLLFAGELIIICKLHLLVKRARTGRAIRISRIKINSPLTLHTINSILLNKASCEILHFYIIINNWSGFCF